MVTGTRNAIGSKNKWTKNLNAIFRNTDLYLLLLPTLVYFFIFHYIPMYGVQIAFKNFMVNRGIMGSSWVGLEHFIRFFNTPRFWDYLENTLALSIYQLIVGFPIPIMLALMINQVGNAKFKKTVQTVTYAPHFISFVVLAGVIYLLLSPRNGLINNILGLVGIDPIYFMGESGWFRTVFVVSGIWQNAGWSTIIYLAALAGVDPELHSAALVDGANKFQRVWHIDIPWIMPTIVILFVLRFGDLMTVGYQKVLLLQNSLNIDTSEVIQTYVYKVGLIDAQFSYSAAIGLFNNVVNFILLIFINWVVKKMNQSSLW